MKIYNRLFFRIYFYFGIVLTVFAILIGFIFMNLYEKSSTESYKKQLEAQGEKIAKKVSQYVINQDYINYDVYREVLEEMQNSETTDIWITTNPHANTPMNKRFENVDLEDIGGLSKGVQKVLNSAFRNKVESTQSYDKTYRLVMMRVATPIHDELGNVVGAVLLNSYVQSYQDIIQRSQKLIVNSTLAALLMSFIIAIIFARQISEPISKIRRITLDLAEGKYDKKTGIEQKDEIGELGGTIDVLAEQLRQNQIESKNMEQMRLDFFANVSHELRTPITVMRGYTEMLVDGVVTGEDKVRPYYERMYQECKSMERLVGDLLILSKMQNPDFVIDAEPLNIIQIFDDIIRGVKVISDKKNITIHIHKEKDNYMIMGDYDRIRQTFLIIIDNAVKFSHENGNVYIDIEGREHVKITIRDEGIGISPEELPFIFEKFYKSKLRQNSQGSGLGLVIAKQIVNRHGGSIEVKSTQGEGTTFVILFNKLALKEEIT